ncbi:hypothetical protein CDV36_009820 [Fusarium kuroshium]|uniref:Beta-lactamase-related domain-containing protein n=1 Tax=Fusarium kuroshium TaxID=2010991 RepID=A0A3M2RZ14_9HYPO|nr:hypothetical protein CDV36_009820 [Fusarium kuroshium]
MRPFLALHVACLAHLVSSQQIPLNEQQQLSESTDHDDSNDVPIADAAFEQYVRDKMARWHAPGLAMAILDGNKTWTRGFGYASLDREPVTPSTLFYCGSMTKSFTAAAVTPCRPVPRLRRHPMVNACI